MKVIQILFMMLPANNCIDLASNVSNKVLMSIVTLSEYKISGGRLSSFSTWSCGMH